MAMTDEELAKVNPNLLQQGYGILNSAFQASRVAGAPVDYPGTAPIQIAGTTPTKIVGGIRNPQTTYPPMETQIPAATNSLVPGEFVPKDLMRQTSGNAFSDASVTAPAPSGPKPFNVFDAAASRRIIPPTSIAQQVTAPQDQELGINRPPVAPDTGYFMKNDALTRGIDLGRVSNEQPRAIMTSPTGEPLVRRSDRVPVGPDGLPIGNGYTSASGLQVQFPEGTDLAQIVTAKQFGNALDKGAAFLQTPQGQSVLAQQTAEFNARNPVRPAYQAPTIDPAVRAAHPFESAQLDQARRAGELTSQTNLGVAGINAATQATTNRIAEQRAIDEGALRRAEADAIPIKTDAEVAKTTSETRLLDATVAGFPAKSAAEVKKMESEAAKAAKEADRSKLVHGVVETTEMGSDGLAVKVNKPIWHNPDTGETYDPTGVLKQASAIPPVANRKVGDVINIPQGKFKWSANGTWDRVK